MTNIVSAQEMRDSMNDQLDKEMTEVMNIMRAAAVRGNYKCKVPRNQITRNIAKLLLRLDYRISFNTDNTVTISWATIYRRRSTDKPCQD